MRPELERFRNVLGRPGLTDCFLSSFFVPQKRFSWTDDASWSLLRDNMRLAARFARESGCVGLFVDHEDYPRQRQFERIQGDPPMPELEVLVRRRGRELFEAVFEEFPDARLFFFWFMTEHARGFNGAAEPLQTLRDANKLWAFFANGILDVMPPLGRIYDGNECSYEYSSEDFEYLIQANAIRQMDGFAFPENRMKYRNQVHPSAALYLQMYCQASSAHRWYRPPFAGSRLGMFRRDLKQALDSVDEYLWTWSEKNPFVRRERHEDGKSDPSNDNSISQNKTFDELMPGFNHSIIAIKDPVRFMNEMATGSVCSAFASTSLVPADFSPNYCWQKKANGRELGNFVADNAVFGASAPSVRIEGVANGCVMSSVAGVQAGEIYVVRVRAKVQSGGFSANVKWKRNGKWRHFETSTALSFGNPDELGWRMGSAVVTTPCNVDTLVLMFHANQDVGDVCWADDVEIVRIDR